MKKIKKGILLSIFILSLVMINKVPVFAENGADFTPAEDFKFRYMWMSGDEENKKIILDEYVGDKTVEEIIIPETYMDNGVEREVVEIGYQCFNGLSNLKRVSLSSTITSIGTEAFINCTSLEKVDGLVETNKFYIGNKAFKECTSLNEFTIYENMEYEVGAAAFKNTPWYENIVNNDEDHIIMMGTTVYDMNNCSGDVKIPENATKISNSAFSQDEEGDILTINHNITSIYIPAGLDDIENFYPIEYSKNLKSITVAEGNEKFFSENGVLYGNDEDFGVVIICYPSKKTGTSFKIKKEIGQIGGIHSEYLEKVTFETGCKPIISPGAFEGCKNLESITIPNGTTMVSQAFRNTGLKSISLPEEFTSMSDSGGSMFTGCTTLESISLDKNNKNFKLVNGALISLNTYDGEKNYQLIGYPASKKGDTLIIPDGVVIAYSLECSKYLKTIIVPKSMEWISIAESKTLGNIKNIKYLGSKEEFDNKVYIGGVYGMEDYEKFNIYYNCKSINNAKINNLKNKYTYTGKSLMPPITVKVRNTALTKGTHYSVSGNSNKNVGKATITLTGKGKYYGTKTLTFMIVPKKVSTLKSELYQYGNKVNVSWSKVTGATGYKVEYKKSNVSKYTHLKYTKNTNYIKEGLQAGKIYNFKITPYYELNGDKYYGTESSCYKTVKITTTTKGNKMASVNQPTVSKSGTKVKVKWKNVNGETGYQISKSTSKTGTNIVTTYKTKTGTSKTITAAKGTTYYYKVRAYRTVNGKNIYGTWSKVRSFKR